MPTTVLLSMLCLLLTACSAGPVTPDGYMTLERDRFSLAVPEDWTVRGDRADLLGVTGPTEVDGNAESVVLQVDDAFRGDFDAGVEAVLQPFRLFIAEDVEEVDRRDIEVAGATQARLIEVTYPKEELGGAISRDYLVFAIADPEGPLVVIQAGASEEIFDRATFDAIVASLEVR